LLALLFFPSASVHRQKRLLRNSNKKQKVNSNSTLAEETFSQNLKEKEEEEEEEVGLEHVKTNDLLEQNQLIIVDLDTVMEHQLSREVGIAMKLKKARMMILLCVWYFLGG